MSIAAGSQVLEFALGDERYCLEIGHIDEIVDAAELTRIPNAPSHVEGVMDLRGRTTSIIDPRELLDVDVSGSRERIIVFDDGVGDGGIVGWMVDEVFQVTDVDPDAVDTTTVGDEAAINGVVKRDDGFVVWLDPTVGATTSTTADTEDVETRA
jgi:purine-binding chemotaxis protein CheW